VELLFTRNAWRFFVVHVIVDHPNTGLSYMVLMLANQQSLTKCLTL